MFFFMRFSKVSVKVVLCIDYGNMYFLEFLQNGNLFYFFFEDWQFVNEFRYVVGEWMN